MTQDNDEKRRRTYIQPRLERVRPERERNRDMEDKIRRDQQDRERREREDRDRRDRNTGFGKRGR